MTTQSHGQLPTERTPSPPSDTSQPAYVRLTRQGGRAAWHPRLQSDRPGAGGRPGSGREYGHGYPFGGMNEKRGPCARVPKATSPPFGYWSKHQGPFVPDESK